MSNMRVEEAPKRGLNTNSYATKKTISQGMLDVALLTANASQLKYCLQLGEKNKFYYVMLCLISTSVVLQVLVGSLFIYVGYINLDHTDRHRSLNWINNLCTIMIFIITVINVFISGFGISTEI